jgi:hypothetical protein
MNRPRQASGGRFPDKPSPPQASRWLRSARPDPRTPDWLRFVASSSLHPQPGGPPFVGRSPSGPVAPESPGPHWVRLVREPGFVGRAHDPTRQSLQNLQGPIGFVLSWRLASFRKRDNIRSSVAISMRSSLGRKRSNAPSRSRRGAPGMFTIVADRPIVLAGPRFDGRRLGSASVPELPPQPFPSRPFSSPILYKPVPDRDSPRGIFHGARQLVRWSGERCPRVRLSRD